MNLNRLLKLIRLFVGNKYGSLVQGDGDIGSILGTPSYRQAQVFFLFVLSPSSALVIVTRRSHPAASAITN